jgi:hypothetical protein
MTNAAGTAQNMITLSQFYYGKKGSQFVGLAGAIEVMNIRLSMQGIRIVNIETLYKRTLFGKVDIGLNVWHERIKEL